MQNTDTAVSAALAKSWDAPDPQCSRRSAGCLRPMYSTDARSPWSRAARRRPLLS